MRDISFCDVNSTPLTHPLTKRLLKCASPTTRSIYFLTQEECVTGIQMIAHRVLVWES